MAYSKYVTEFNDKDNNTYGVMDAENRAETEQLKNALEATGLIVIDGELCQTYEEVVA